MPNLFDETHPYCLKEPFVQSTLFGARLVKNGATLYPHSYFMSTQSPSIVASPTLKDRAFKKLHEPLFWFRFNRFLRKKIRKVPPSVLHVHFGTTAARILPFLKKIPAPLIVSFYGIDASESLRIPFFKKKYRDLFKRADKVIVLCDAVKVRLTEAGCEAKKIKVWNLPAGIEKYPFSPRLKTASTRFLICARFVEKKGYPYLLKAFKQVIQKGYDSKLTLLGYGPLKEILVKEIRALDLDSTVSLIDTNLSKNFDALYKNTLSENDIFVLPSTTASNGDDEAGPALTLVCAQSSGLPVICTSFPGAELSMINGETGLFCEQDNVDSLADKMIWMIENKDHWNKMGKAGSALVEKHFSLKGQMQIQMDLYKELIHS